jgi:protein-S-isoprenylcysteine O-methyltransferase Ste14
MKTLLQALAASLFGIIIMGLLLFLPAGTFNYWQAWVFIVIFTVATLIPSIYLAVEDPAALQRRRNAGPMAETRALQKVIVTATIVAVVAVLVVSALDHRLGWSHVPTSVVVLGNILVALGLGIAQVVVLQNSYAAATIIVETDQKVVTTGLYGLVRHPMYVGALIMMMGTALALGSYWGLLAVAVALPVLAARIDDEEKMLRQELDGYDEYTQKVHYRLVPGVW